jgi:Glycosyltransferase family 87
MATVSPSDQPWLNERRVRAQGICLALALWGVYAWVLATPGLRDRNGLIKGTDFLHFYTLGMLADGHRGADLYNMAAQTKLLGERVPEALHTVYLPLYGPQVSLLFGPFAAVSYAWALITWWVCITALYAACLYAVWKASPNLGKSGGTVFILALAYPAFFNLIAWGQTSALALACFTAGYLFLRRERWFAAGLALGCLMFKPQLGLVVAFVFCATGAWQVIAGAALSASAQLIVGWAYYGSGVMREYVQQMRHVDRLLPLLEPRIEQTHCLRTFWQMMIPNSAVAWGLYVVSGLVVLWLALKCWRSSLPLGLRYSALLLATVLVSPHLTVYDLVILAPALLLVADWVVGGPVNGLRRQFVMAMYLVYLLPMVGILTRWSHVQISVIAMSFMLWLVWKISEIAGPPRSVKTLSNTASLGG